MLYGDQNRYMQIFNNFLSNALKFTSQDGQISVNIVLQELHKPKNDVMINNTEEIDIIKRGGRKQESPELYAKF